MKQHVTSFHVKAAKNKTVLQFPPSRELQKVGTLRGTYARLTYISSVQHLQRKNNNGLGLGLRLRVRVKVKG
jgi:hypothetical protein